MQRKKMYFECPNHNRNNDSSSNTQSNYFATNEIINNVTSVSVSQVVMPSVFLLIQLKQYSADIFTVQ